MLAYLFWHWPLADVDRAAYEQRQRAFHRALQQAAPSGFQQSVVFRIDGQAPWLHGTPTYADWYLLDDSAALDRLNAAAVAGACQAPHADLAAAMAAGAGSLLGLRSGQARLEMAHTVTWLSKPRGMPYATFDATLADRPGVSESSLWRRQLVLGPTPEFALLSGQPPRLPEPFQPLTLGLEALWPASS
jgi:hypothetical protein